MGDRNQWKSLLLDPLPSASNIPLAQLCPQPPIYASHITLYILNRMAYYPAKLLVSSPSITVALVSLSWSLLMLGPHCSVHCGNMLTDMNIGSGKKEMRQPLRQRCINSRCLRQLKANVMRGYSGVRPILFHGTCIQISVGAVSAFYDIQHGNKGDGLELEV